MIHAPNVFRGGRHLKKYPPRDTLQGFHVISRNFAGKFFVFVDQTATCVRFREISREISCLNAALNYV